MQVNRVFFNWSFRPGGWIFLVILIPFMLVGLILLGIAGYQLIQQQGYQSGQCTITAKQLRHEVSTTTSTTNNGSTTTRTTTSQDVYAPYFEYQVHTANGQSYQSSGYDGSDSYTSDRDGQQAIVDRYTIGQSYQCWYNPAHPTQAVLIRQLNWVLIIIGGIFLLVSLFIGSIAFLITRTSMQGAAGGATMSGPAGFSNDTQYEQWQDTDQSSTEPEDFSDDRQNEEWQSQSFYEPQQGEAEQSEQQGTGWSEEDWRKQ